MMRRIIFLSVLMMPGLLYAGTFTQRDTVQKNEWRHYGPFEATDGDFVANLVVAGDADLYVKEGNQPSSYSYDCRPYDGANVTETCTMNGPGTFFFSVRGYSSSTDYELTVNFNGDKSCFVDADCKEEGTFCQLPFGECGGEGMCSANVWAMMCTQQYDPICSCDGETFSNACMAMLAMQNVAYQGVCHGDEGGMCGGIAGFMCQDGLYCKGLDPKIADDAGICMSDELYCEEASVNNDCASAIHPAVPGQWACADNHCSWDPYIPTFKCDTDADCEKDSYCQKQPGDCNGVGECKSLIVAMNCPPFEEPVCGCDGETYQNGCQANRAGVSIFYEGICRGDEGGMCGGIAGFPCDDGLYCKGMDPTISDPAGECRPLSYCYSNATAEVDCAPWSQVIRPAGPGGVTCADHTCVWALDVSIVDLLSHPEEYNGKYINVAWEVGETICLSCNPHTQYKMILEDSGLGVSGEITLREVSDQKLGPSPSDTTPPQGKFLVEPSRTAGGGPAPEPQRYMVTGLFVVENSDLGSKNYLDVIRMIDAPLCVQSPGCPGRVVVDVDERGCYLYECPDLNCSYADQTCPEGYECVWGCPTAAPCGINPPGECVKRCGGRLGDTCAEDEYCHYEKSAECGRGDKTGVCQSYPQNCTDIGRLVCGCDGETYSNECYAWTEGVSVDYEGACRRPVEQVTVQESDTIYRNVWHNYTYMAEAGTFTAELTMNADADLYVKLDSAPNSDSYDCRPYKGGSSTEICTLNLTESTLVHVAVHGWDNQADYDLTLTYLAEAE